MIQIVTSWNLSNPRRESSEIIDKITLRGYNVEEVYLTGEFATRIKEGRLRSLSVSEIADLLCPTRRDLYINKGLNRPNRVRTKPRWGRKAGQVIEKYLYEYFEDLCRKKKTMNYYKIRYKLNKFTKDFISDNSHVLNELGNLKQRAEEDPTWLIKLLNINGRVEYASKNMHSTLQKGCKADIDICDIETNLSSSLTINPNPYQIGISTGVKPDFRISKWGIIGDIKSGIGGFQDRYLLTCAGYALANENERRKKGNINFGIVYLFPTRHSKYVKPISFAQVYIFPIDDNLRQWFIDTRNQAYAVIAEKRMPRFPKINEREPCATYCKYYEFCKSQGLKYEENRSASN